MSHCGPSKMKEAAQYFEKGGMLLRAIECYEQIGEWELKILEHKYTWENMVFWRSAAVVTPPGS